MNPVDRIESSSAPLTLVFQSPDILTPLDWRGRRFVIDAATALYHANRVHKLHTRTMPDAAMVFGDRVWFEGWRKWAHGPRAVIGRIDLHHKLREMSVPVVHQQPEDGLHPAQAVELGDLFIRWTREPDS
jgi:hypothetical protein